MGEGFAFACWVRLNFPPGVQPPPWRQAVIYDFWRDNDRHRWWCSACQEYHVNVG